MEGEWPPGREVPSKPIPGSCSAFFSSPLALCHLADSHLAKGRGLKTEEDTTCTAGGGLGPSLGAGAQKSPITHVPAFPARSPAALRLPGPGAAAAAGSWCCTALHHGRTLRLLSAFSRFCVFP